MKSLLSILLILVFHTICFAQPSYKISGFIQDSSSNEKICGAFIVAGSEYSISNEYGYYTLQLKEGTHTIEVALIGYTTLYKTIQLHANMQLNLKLSTSPYTIDLVTVTADHSMQALYCKTMPITQLMQTPTVFGEPDVLKVMQLQPGIKNIGDASSGMYVRGGSKDQNLISIDGASMYSVSHMFGLVSMCNPLLLKDVKFYNSYIPAEYGGRVSSVLDMQLKEGNNTSFSSDIIISTLTANIGIEGPIQKDKSSFFIAARRSTLEKIFKMYAPDAYLPSFYDLIAKTNVTLNTKNAIYVSFFYGFDNNSREHKNTLHQKNLAFTTRWIYTPAPDFLIHTSVIRNKYSALYKQDSITNNDGTYRNIIWNTGVSDYTFKTKCMWHANSANRVNFGLSSIYHEFTPGTANTRESSISPMNILEHSVFVEDNIKWSKNWNSKIGIRYMLYQNIGKAYWYTYDEMHNPIAEQTQQNGIWNSFQTIEPRFRIAYTKPKYEFSLAYTRTSQAMQILTNNALAYSEMETWIPISPNIKPILCDNVAVGYTYANKTYAFLIEGYYKYIQNQLDYVDHAQLYGNPFIEAELRTGTAQAYGIESSIQKKIGKTKGTISYTLSRVMFSIPEITLHTKYRAPYDIPHDIKIQVIHDFNSSWNVGLLWVYATGRPTSVPVGMYYYTFSPYVGSSTEPTPIYSERNSVNFPDYHRLDISCGYTFTAKKHLEHSLSFGIYNAYGRVNPLSYDISLIQYNDISVYHFFTFFPSLSYKAKIF